ncbi:MAG: HAD family phosphatase [Bacteroidales bacterium]|nr:HAD family phosphatase [Bacteroidales bacterium]
MKFPLVLFDLDGVLIHTEPAYTAFWAEIGREYFPENPDFAPAIKGHSLTDILHTYFNGAGSKADEVVARLSAFQRQMDFPLIPGALEFVGQLRAQGVRTAVVTSSNREKMEHLYEAIPSFPTLFDRIFTAEDAGRSKPAPDCYLRAAAAFGLEASACAVFEDSPSGLEAARRSGARVYGVATDLLPEEIRPLCDEVVERYDTLKFI